MEPSVRSNKVLNQSVDWNASYFSAIEEGFLNHSKLQKGVSHPTFLSIVEETQKNEELENENEEEIGLQSRNQEKFLVMKRRTGSGKAKEAEIILLKCQLEWVPVTNVFEEMASKFSEMVSKQNVSRFSK